MGNFFVEHFLEIIFGLISAGALAFCTGFYKKMQDYRKLLNEKKHEEWEDAIENRIEPILTEIEELRKYIRDIGTVEKTHMDLIVSSYRFRLVQLCKNFIKQGYMTQDQYDQLTEFYKIYTGLGGNGQAKEYYETAMKLEIK